MQVPSEPSDSQQTCHRLDENTCKQRLDAASPHSFATKEMRYRERAIDRAATSALPGTAEKIELMRRRIEGGFQPFHPDDRRFDEHRAS